MFAHSVTPEIKVGASAAPETPLQGRHPNRNWLASGRTFPIYSSLGAARAELLEVLAVQCQQEDDP
jgi:hypothetical protein